MIKKLLHFTLACWVMLHTTVAFGALEIVITEGVDTARPIGIVPFKYC
jgi:TolB protein